MINRRQRTPEEARAAVERADRLRAWMASHRYQGRPVTQTMLIELTGLAESIVSGFLARSGQYRDLAGLQAGNVSKLVDGMRKVNPQLTGESIAEMLGIPVERRDRWIGIEQPLPERIDTTGYAMGAVPAFGPSAAGGSASAFFPQASPVSLPPADVQTFQVQAMKTVQLQQPLLGVVTAPGGWTVITGPDQPAGAVLWFLATGAPWSLPAGINPGPGSTRVGSIRSLNAPD